MPLVDDIEEALGGVEQQIRRSIARNVREHPVIRSERSRIRRPDEGACKGDPLVRRAAGRASLARRAQSRLRPLSGGRNHADGLPSCGQSARAPLFGTRTSGAPTHVSARRSGAQYLTAPNQAGTIDASAALRYVLLNARRHAAKKETVSTAVARIDPAFSGRWFEGWNRRMPNAPERDGTRLHRPPVARAKTWLLAVGWRRHGLLDPADIPG
jgi:hypothetical protein